MSTIFVQGLMAALLVGSPAVIRSQAPAGGDLIAIQGFDRRIAEYVELHRRLEGPLPTLEISEDLREVRAAMRALARQIQAARRGAHQGDVFTPDITRVLRKRIAECLPPEDMAAILAEHDEDAPAIRPRLRVSAEWPDEAVFNFVPPQLLAALPPLPSELQYRIIGRALVLWDHHANLIVDFLPGAFTS